MLSVKHSTHDDIFAKPALTTKCLQLNFHKNGTSLITFSTIKHNLYNVTEHTLSSVTNSLAFQNLGSTHETVQ